MKLSYSFLLFLTVLLLTHISYAQEIYTVNGKTVNVRSGPGVGYQVLRTYSNGNKIYVYEKTNQWAKIKLTETEFGYISTNFISEDYSVSDKEQINADGINKKSNFEIGLWIIAGILVIWFFLRLSKRCSKCRKWNAVRTIGREIIDEKPSSIKKVDTITDNKGNKHQNICRVPATIYTYRVYKKCRKCGNSYSYTETKKTEN